MILYENEFLKTYDDMSKLWEDQESTEQDRKPEAKVSFSDIFKELNSLGNSDHLQPEEYQFWANVRRIMETKFKRPGSQNKPWYVRLAEFFYKPYLVENALQEAINNKSFSVNIDLGSKGIIGDIVINITLGEVKPNDPFRSGIYSGYYAAPVNSIDVHEQIKAVADFKTSSVSVQINSGEVQPLGVTCIECKSSRARSNTYGAPIVLRYDANYKDGFGSFYYQLPVYIKTASNDEGRTAVVEQISPIWQAIFKAIKASPESLPTGVTETNSDWYDFKIIAENTEYDADYNTLADNLKKVEKLLNKRGSEPKAAKAAKTVLVTNKTNLLDAADKIKKLDGASTLYVEKPKLKGGEGSNLTTLANQVEKAADYLVSVAKATVYSDPQDAIDQEADT